MGAIYETFSVCVPLSRNVVGSFAEGYSDDLDDKKYGARYMIFCSRFGGLYTTELYARLYSTLEPLDVNAANFSFPIAHTVISQ